MHTFGTSHRATPREETIALRSRNQGKCTKGHYFFSLATFAQFSSSPNQKY